MNKFLIVLLAVCLVSVHAFVKRDAPDATAEKTALEKIQDTLAEIQSKIEKNMPSSDDIGKNYNKVMDDITKAVKAFLPTTAAPPAA